MRVLIASAILLLPLSASAADRRPSPPAKGASVEDARICSSVGIRHADLNQAPGARPLGDLPAGNLLLAVQRDVDGCLEPALVRQGIGAQPAPREQQKVRRIRL